MTLNRENSLKKLERLSKESHQNLTDSENPWNYWRNTSKVSQGNTTVCRFLQCIRFSTKRKDGANTTSIWSSQRNCYSYYDALQKHEINGSLIDFNIDAGVLQWNILAPYLFILCLEYVLRTSIDWIKRQAADDISQQLWQKLTAEKT